MSIEQFRSTLTAIGLDTTPQEVAEILWLAAQLQPGTVSAEPSKQTPETRLRSPNLTTDDDVDTAAPPDSGRVPVHAGTRDDTAGTADRLPARVIRLPAGSPLRQRLHLLRALRPLKRRVPSRHLNEIDEDQTAERSAEGFLTQGNRALVPVVRPARERWLDVILVVDSHPTSRMLWTSLINDIHQLLRQLGAFRDVRVRFLHPTSDGSLRVSSDSSPRNGPLRSTAELCDPSGRRLILILTDGVAPGWNHPQTHDAVRHWAEAGPVAFIQALPEHLWPHTALPVVPATLRRPAHSTANTDLTFTGHRRRTRTLPAGSVPIPVLELAPQWLGPWARLIGQQGNGSIDTAVMLLGMRSRAAAAPDTRTPEMRLQDFHATATPDAFRLLSCLSAVPLNVSVMRVVQSAMLRDSPPSVLAEVMFSGLLEATEATENTPAEELPYDFLPGIRPALLAGMRSHEVDSIHLEVSRYLERSAAGAPGRITGLIPDIRGTAALPASDIPWTRISASLLAGAGQSEGTGTRAPERARHPAPVGAEPDPLAGPYRLTNYLTRANFSDVFLALDDQENEALVKVERSAYYPSAPGLFRALLQTEAESLRRMGGKYAPKLLGVDTKTAAPWMAMEVVRSESRRPAANLSSRAWAQNSAPSGPLPLLHLLRQLAEMLERAHSRGIVHGNLSPHAVLMVPNSVVVISWMYAQHDGQPHRYPSYRPTREEFLPPEGYSTAEPLAPSFDVYAVGAIVAREMNRLGTVPHDQYSLDPLDAPPFLAQIIERCMADDPAERPTAEELLRETRLDFVDGRHSATAGPMATTPPEAGTERWDQAVHRYRALTETDPDAYLPDLAMSLNNLSIRLGAVGRRAEGLTAVEEAVAIRRTLAETHPGAYLPDLAASLNNLSVRLGEVGRRAEGLTAVEEAVGHYRTLAETHPDAYLPDLAASLNNLSIDLGEVGRRAEGLTAVEEAVAIRRTLAEANPDAYLPDLAASLNNLSIRLGEVGRRAEGLTAVEEAVAIRRTLAEANPDAYLPDLATSLNNLSIRLGEVGRRAEGLTAVEEAVGHYRTLAEANPDLFRPALQQALEVAGGLKGLDP